MDNLTNDQLLEVLKNRFRQNEESLDKLKQLTRELQKANEHLEESEAMKSQFLSNIRNEINNPFASILALARSITTLEGGEMDKAHKMANLIYAEAAQLDFQLRNIFCAAEIEAGDLYPELAQVPVYDMLEEVIANFSGRASKKQLVVQLSNALPDQYTFTTDEYKLRLALSNLLANAIEFTEVAGSEIYIYAEEAGEQLVIRVTDQGPGLNEEEIKLIFSRFRQLTSGSTKTHRGHGLGLSVAASCLELLNGTLNVESTKNSGSTFIITLPKTEIPTEEGLMGSEDIMFEDGELF